MAKRATVKASLRIAMLTPRCRADGVWLGLLLTLMFWGGLLLRCGDVETNPGPNSDQPVLKQTRLTRGMVRSSSADAADKRGQQTDTADASTGSSDDTPGGSTIADLATMISSLTSTMNSKFENVEKHVDNGVRDLSEQFAKMQSGIDGLRDEVNELRKENED